MATTFGSLSVAEGADFERVGCLFPVARFFVALEVLRREEDDVLDFVVFPGDAVAFLLRADVDPAAPADEADFFERVRVAPLPVSFVSSSAASAFVLRDVVPLLVVFFSVLEVESFVRAISLRASLAVVMRKAREGRLSYGRATDLRSIGK